MAAHPISRFSAPRSIQTGSSLAALFDPIAIVKERRWLIRHAVRHPAKKGDALAHDLRRRAAA